jgi:hypothetical protein
VRAAEESGQYLEEIRQHFAADVDAADAAGVWLPEYERHHVCI